MRATCPLTLFEFIAIFLTGISERKKETSNREERLALSTELANTVVYTFHF
jgi:hypothetical protein